VLYAATGELIRIAVVFLCRRGETTPPTNYELEGAQDPFLNLEICYLNAGTKIPKASEGRHSNAA
jgi:hypothetical protein